MLSTVSFLVSFVIFFFSFAVTSHYSFSFSRSEQTAISFDGRHLVVQPFLLNEPIRSTFALDRLRKYLV